MKSLYAQQTVFTNWETHTTIRYGVASKSTNECGNADSWFKQVDRNDKNLKHIISYKGRQPLIIGSKYPWVAAGRAQIRLTALRQAMDTLKDCLSPTTRNHKS